MISQVSSTGMEGRSQCSRCTVVGGHHGGLRQNPQPVIDSIESDSAAEKGWITKGRTHPFTVPVRLVPKNVVSQHKWRIVKGIVEKVLKWRVTTDDSHETQGQGSRNGSMPREEWPECKFPSLQNFAEAVAIVRSSAAAMGLSACTQELERIALWALDLSDAYRMLAVNRSEW